MTHNPHHINDARPGEEPNNSLPARVGPLDLDALLSAGPISRRSVLKLLGASAALALGVPGCKRKPARRIVSRASGPEYQPPGKYLYYSSTWTEGPIPYGMVVTAIDGRPIKIEGHPDHPLNRGGATAAMQAGILSLYDPDRLRGPLHQGSKISWSDADREFITALRQAKSVVLLTRSTLSPSEQTLLGRLQAALPQMQHFVHESIHDGPRRSAWRKIFGASGEWVPALSQARVILSLESDFLATDGPVLQSIRDFTEARQLDESNPARSTMARLYVVESALTLTGSNADHRLRLRPSAVLELVQFLRGALQNSEESLRQFARRQRWDEKVCLALLADLRAHRGGAVVLAGAHLPEPVHAAVALLNEQLEAFGHTLAWNPAPATLPVTNPVTVENTLRGGVDVLICLGVNPVYDWPGGGFECLLPNARLSVAHSLYLDETAALCTFALPSSHTLESWNDARPRLGLDSICQPLIAPLFESRQEAQSLFAWIAALAPGDPQLASCRDWHDFLQRHWQERFYPSVIDPAEKWDDILRRGFMMSPIKTAAPALQRDAAESLARADLPAAGTYELVLLPHPVLHDGRFANNAWLQELPDAVSKLVWDNAAAVSPQTARELAAREGDLIDIKAGPATITLPLLIQGGLADNVIITTLGHGRTRAGSVGAGIGVNTAPLLQKNAAPRWLASVDIQLTGKTYPLVRTQLEFSLQGRPIVIDADLHEYLANPQTIQARRPRCESADLYQPYDYSQSHKWALAVDLNACIGCGACVTACQAENNIFVVGKEQCARTRQMHWLRIDRYHSGPADNPTAHHQPMLCQHCDNAPCEGVCPVNATAHSPEGLNEQIYNRCVGTRYCSNNCPYKVRRFNFLRYQEMTIKDPVQELAFNPQVTVRSVGVMEKCTFCIQRINAAKFRAANANQPLAADAIQTACQQACPARAIVFGDVNQPDSRIARLRSSPRVFYVLEELHVRPNVSYLARIRNRAVAGEPA